MIEIYKWVCTVIVSSALLGVALVYVVGVAVLCLDVALSALHKLKK